MSTNLPPKKFLKIPQVEKKIQARLDELTDAMIDLALGHYRLTSKFNAESGEVEQKVYLVEPDYKALAFLIENAIGKTPQRIEMTGDGGGPIKVVPWMTMAESIRLGTTPLELAGGDDIEAEVTEVILEH